MTGGVEFTLIDVILANNSLIAGSRYGGSNFGVDVIDVFNGNATSSNKIRMYNCRLESGHSVLGGGAFFTIFKNSYVGLPLSRNIIKIVNTSFVNNTAQDVGGGVYMRLHTPSGLSNTPLAITFIKCNFTSNKIASEKNERGGVAVNLVDFKAKGSVLQSSPQYAVTFNGCKFNDNSFHIHPNTQSLSSGVVFIEDMSNVTFEDCEIGDNQCTGIAAVNSYIRFIGTNAIKNNNAEYGGGLLLGDSSSILLTVKTNLTISHNHANKTGGGIYAQTTSVHAIPPCFFQFDKDDANCNSTLQNRIHVYLQNNTATIAGTALYGGLIDDCYLLKRDTTFYTPKNNCTSSSVFDHVFHYSNDTSGPSVISSDPLYVCLCTYNATLDNYIKDCELLQLNQTVSPGETITISAVVVGQRDGVVPGSIVGQISFNDGLVEIDMSQALQKVGNSCSSLEYSVFSQKEHHTANLALNVPDYFENFHAPVILINISACPVGFKLISNHCGCSDTLQSYSISCNPQKSTIHRPAGLWIGYATRKIITKNNAEDINVKLCPRLYCSPDDINITAYSHHLDQNVQCYYYRTGVLCGSCAHGLSIAFGSFKCTDCYPTKWWRLIAVSGGLLLSGIALILFLLAFDLTVTEGAISGFIFYANIVNANISFFFQGEDYFILQYFIAWLNLDLGWHMCFYDGMTTLVQMYLEFLYPLYIWFLTWVLILLSRKFNLMARPMRNNGTQVLATLILMSYSKLLEAIMFAFSGTTLKTDHGAEWVWYYNGNLPYFDIYHLPLFLIAVAFSIILLPFTFVLLFIKQFSRLSSLWMLCWVNKLKPLFDSYTGPYNDSFHFWPGLLLVIRMIYLICTSLHIDDTIPIQVVGICLLLLSIHYVYSSRVYKKHFLNVLEACLLFNLALWTSVLTTKYSTFFFFVVTVFLTFLGILCLRGYKQVSKTQFWTRHIVEPVSILCKAFKEKLQSCFRNMRGGESTPNERSPLIPDIQRADYSNLREPLMESGEI